MPSRGGRQPAHSSHSGLPGPVARPPVSSSAGSAREPSADDPWPLQPGTFGAYVVTDAPDALFERAEAAGADVLVGLHDTDYGSRDFMVKDPEGNHWSFGTYRGEPRKG